MLRDPEVYGLTEKERDARVKASTKLALEYSVLTEKTAFVAVDTTVVVNPDGSAKTVAVPVEVPDGMDGAAVGEAYGLGGLGLRGTGRGGGGTGTGTIGLGNTGLIGKGGGGGTGNGYGRGSGSGFGGSGKRVPRVRQAKATVTGSLDKDIIRRIVRAHINEVRYCYEKGLAVDPNLKGRVAVTFTIDAEGKVIKVLREEQRVIVEGVNRIKRHTKVVNQGGRAGTTGGIITTEAPIHVSNVMLVEGDGVTRIGFRRGTLLRAYMIEFMRMFAGHQSAPSVEQVIQCHNQSEIDSLFSDTVLPELHSMPTVTR